jgi:hypothetical protein
MPPSMTGGNTPQAGWRRPPSFGVCDAPEGRLKERRSAHAGPPAHQLPSIFAHYASMCLRRCFSIRTRHWCTNAVHNVVARQEQRPLRAHIP